MPIALHIYFRCFVIAWIGLVLWTGAYYLDVPVKWGGALLVLFILPGFIVGYRSGNERYKGMTTALLVMSILGLAAIGAVNSALYGDADLPEWQGRAGYGLLPHWVPFTGDQIDHLRRKAVRNTIWGNGFWFMGKPGHPPPPEQLLAEAAPHISTNEGKVTHYTFLEAKTFGYNNDVTYILFDSNLGKMILEVQSNEKDWSWRPMFAE